LLFAGGVIGFIGTTVLAAHSTLKLDNLLDEAKSELDRVRNAVPEDAPLETEVVDTETGEKVTATIETEKVESQARIVGYTMADQKRDITIVYAQTAAKVLKLYAPPILLGAASIVMLSKSHNMLMKRNAALMAAYTAVDTAFKEYRKRVRDKYGEDIDLAMRYGTETTEVIAANGKPKTIKHAGREVSMYARWFDQVHSDMWSKDPEANYITVRAQQRYFNELLITRGHVFLNEVYKGLGLSHTEAGAIVGWRMTQSQEGDNFIDFGLFRDDSKVREFLNGTEGSILLDFNVDGVIYDKLDKPPVPLSWAQEPST
jgi:hypothetical protein